MTGIIPDDFLKKFGDLPDVPHLSNVRDYEHAISLLFDGEAENITENRAQGGELFIAYGALHSGKKHFIKVIREDNPYSKNMYYSYEWNLRDNLDSYSWLQNVGAELVVPDKGATFLLDNYKHYITSYEYIPGKTLIQIFRDYVIASCYFSANNKKRKLLDSFKRYGQVMALLHFDPGMPETDYQKLMVRRVRLMLSDRNGTNEIYDAVDDRLYLIDLSEEKDEDNTGTVESGLRYWVISVVDVIISAQDEYGSRKRTFADLLYLLIDAFIDGYISSLPEYDAGVLRRMILSLLESDLQDQCQTAFWLKPVIQKIHDEMQL
ncbi:hypothetical protein [Endozoicomonas euniceicola]|uniref:Uncharacterized protein n=1 Tax=Endozoicomonas euniceicola TaxID=1234143 RepID=A0ABY6GX40_9GAMM|nr:hypothetical protein [Endozoicomonas euniceicola]UYM17347.1 hypothetical protein NX720_05350 [Endozoicomonas euniceicola]